MIYLNNFSPTVLDIVSSFSLDLTSEVNLTSSIFTYLPGSITVDCLFIIYYLLFIIYYLVLKFISYYF